MDPMMLEDWATAALAKAAIRAKAESRTRVTIVFLSLFSAACARAVNRRFVRGLTRSYVGQRGGTET
jgi:hypothetical protein